jgi:hypothetical protein
MSTATQPPVIGDCPISQYRDMWDVPRMFVVETDGHALLFDCPFDEEREDYAREYAVYQMPALSDGELAGSWADLPDRAVRRLGAVPVADVAFGPDPRTAVSRASVEPFVNQLVAAAAPRRALWAACGFGAVGIGVAVVLLIDAVWLHRINPFAFVLFLLVALALVQLGAAILRSVRSRLFGGALPAVFRLLLRAAEQPSFAVATLIPVIAIYAIKVYPWIRPVIQEG